MRCNTKNRPMTATESKILTEMAMQANSEYINYVSRLIYIQLYQAFNFRKKNMKRLNDVAYDLTEGYIKRYTPEDVPMQDEDYAVDSYFGMRLRLEEIGFDPETVIWGTVPFGADDFPAPSESAKEREQRKMYLHYANQLAFYQREMMCGVALALHSEFGFGKRRLERLFAPVAQRYRELMQKFLVDDRLWMRGEMLSVLDEYNKMGIFTKETKL